MAKPKPEKKPNPAPTTAQREYARSIGLKVSRDATRSDLFVAVLKRHARRRRLAKIVYLTSIDGKSWSARIEPYAFQRSREGLRVRCFVHPDDPEPDVVADFQTSGWHLYLVDDIEDVSDGGDSFAPRPYSRVEDEATFSIEDAQS